MADWRNEGVQLVTLGSVKADGTPDIADIQFQFPVPHQQMSVRQAVIMDDARVPGRSGKVKQAVGYEDATIEITLLLVDEEDRAGNVTKSSLEQFEEIQRAFRDRSDPIGATTTTSRNVPTVYSIASRLTDAHGIKTVLFQGMDTAEEPGSTDLTVTLSFVEFDPTVLLAEKRKKKKTLTAQEEWDAYTADTIELDYADAMAKQDLAVEEAHDDVVLEEPGRLEKAYMKGYASAKAAAMAGKAP